MEVLTAQELHESIDVYVRPVEVSLTLSTTCTRFPNHPATLYIDTAAGELRARAFPCLAGIIFSAPLLSANRCELLTNSRSPRCCHLLGKQVF